MTTHKLTKRFVDELAFTTTGQKLYWDTELKNFGVQVGKTKKTYIVQKRINGRTVRVTVGTHDPLIPETARKYARQKLVEMEQGVNPIVEKRLARQRGITLEDAFKDFEKSRKRLLAAGTWVNYEDFLENHLSDWKHKSLRDINGEMVISRHQKITKNNGKYIANHVLKFLQTLYRFIQAEQTDLVNPVDIMSRRQLWNPATRRRGYIKNHQLKKWYDGVRTIENSSVRDCFIFLLFTGMRKSEAFALEWKNVDFTERTILVLHTKNKKSLKLPMSDFLFNLLLERRKTAGESKWVFQGDGKDGHIKEIRKASLRIIKETGIEFIPHDLRRTFITIADSLDISRYALKALLNHSLGGDVTGGYIQADVERIREATNKIAQKIEGLIQSTGDQASAVQTPPVIIQAIPPNMIN